MLRPLLLEECAKRSVLSAKHRRILIWLIRQKSTWVGFGINTVAKRLRMSERTVQYAFRTLEGFGVLHKETEEAHGRVPRGYSLNYQAVVDMPRKPPPAEAAEPPAPPDERKWLPTEAELDGYFRDIEARKQRNFAPLSCTPALHPLAVQACTPACTPVLHRIEFNTQALDDDGPYIDDENPLPEDRDYAANETSLSEPRRPMATIKENLEPFSVMAGQTAGKPERQPHEMSPAQLEAAVLAILRGETRP